MLFSRYFAISFLIFAFPLLSFLVVTLIYGHKVGSSPPPLRPHYSYGSWLEFLSREDFKYFLPSSYDSRLRKVHIKQVLEGCVPNVIYWSRTIRYRLHIPRDRGQLVIRIIRTDTVASTNCKYARFCPAVSYSYDVGVACSYTWNAIRRRQHYSPNIRTDAHILSISY